MKPTGTKFKTKDGKEWEVVNTNLGLFLTCVHRGKTLEFRDFDYEELEGVEFY
ncbi:hypothetical protein [Clostridium saccharobutylicum]|uniref:Uncharacterized protein n=1 Tax=Clostridium saccharobutylicum DSM 13864 TaxID=1345695 RepID=U5MWI6_CLOSA|nr:hypothetical protein [Clostridium saccharobutylicum]AGX43991.1 hypothetical protein CLSA_c30240 [Clostridium saccharobutylicum DSM 13864]AQR91286.1 hypothetical protein CLOSC_30100 [Clostridium saccharobutylicum]AQS01190.1 hypothetical protein CSACC_30170 [Clostridium saccharobutylicum]AQS15173.1 hypothetical protein CLOSACC_30170 [Clostridium saccharobutylicum]MBA2905301.1 hypothetical protein [Clostridium saccharobutylicum]